MKKIGSLLTLCISLSFMASAQNGIPNANFENWTTGINNRDSLIGWSSSNAVAINPVKPLTKDSSNTYQGNYSAMLITAPFGFVQYSKVGILVNGDNATFTWNGGSNGYGVELESGGGSPINFKPTELKGYYNFTTSSSGVNGLAQVYLTKYNSTLQSRDTVASGTADLTPNSAYDEFTVYLPDLMPGTTPDTIITIFYSANPTTVPNNGAWTTLYLDSLTLVTPQTPPVADFEADSTNVSTNSTVHLYDSSSNNPTSWGWSFSPATVSFQNGTTDTSKNPVIKFDAAGDYSVTLVANNSDGSDTLTKTNYIHVVEGTNGIHSSIEVKSNLFYPNPVTNLLHLNKEYIGASFQITDLNGRVLVKERKVTHPEIDVKHLPSGIYILRLYTNSSIVSDKFEVRHH